MRLVSERPTAAMRAHNRIYPQFSALCMLVFLLGTGWSQDNGEGRDVHMPSQEQGRQQGDEQLNVDLLYGAYVPKDAPLVSLTGHQRVHLFVLQTFTTPGIYVKTTFLALVNQASGAPYEWGGGKVSDAARLSVLRGLQYKTSFRPLEMQYSITSRAMTVVAVPASAPERSTL